MKALTAAKLLLFGAAILAYFGVVLAQARSPASLCHAAESVLFTCQIAVKTISICGRQKKQGQNEAGTDQAGAVYRYGRQGQVELEVTNLHRAFEGWAGGGETQVYADTSTHRYVVYDRMVRTGFDRKGHSLSLMTQGLLVQSGGRTVLSRQCTPPVGAEPPAFNQKQIEALVPQGTYVPDPQ